MSNHRLTHMPVTAFKAAFGLFFRARVWGLFGATREVQLGGERFQVAGEVWYRAVGSVAWSLAIPVWPFLIVFMLSFSLSLGRRGT